MAPYVQYASVFVDAVDRFPYLSAQKRKLLLRSDYGQLAGLQIFLHLPEYPRGTKTCTPYHHAVYSIGIESMFCLLCSLYVAVADDRNLYAWVCFHLSDESPVGISGIHLRARAPMDCQRLYAAVLQARCKLGDYLVFAVPAEACLDCHRDVDCFHHSLCDGEHLFRIAQHSCSRTFSCHLLHRASEVDVEYVRARLLYNLCRLHHSLWFATIDLYCHGAFAVVDSEFAGCGIDVAHECLCRHEFRIDHRCPLLTAYQPERRVSDIFHRSQHHRTLP